MRRITWWRARQAQPRKIALCGGELVQGLLRHACCVHTQVWLARSHERPHARLGLGDTHMEGLTY